MVLILLTVGVAAEQYGHGFLETLGYIDVFFATILLVLSFVFAFAKASKPTNVPPAIRR